MGHRKIQLFIFAFCWQIGQMLVWIHNVVVPDHSAGYCCEPGKRIVINRATSFCTLGNTIVIIWINYFYVDASENCPRYKQCECLW